MHVGETFAVIIWLLCTMKIMHDKRDSERDRALHVHTILILLESLNKIRVVMACSNDVCASEVRLRPEARTMYRICLDFVIHVRSIHKGSLIPFSGSPPSSYGA